MGCLRRLIGTVLGLMLLPIGLVLIVLPGPGLLVLAASTGLLWWGWHKKKPKDDAD
jgi:hypothetical protein